MWTPTSSDTEQSPTSPYHEPKTNLFENHNDNPVAPFSPSTPQDPATITATKQHYPDASSPPEEDPRHDATSRHLTNPRQAPSSLHLAQPPPNAPSRTAAAPTLPNALTQGEALISTLEDLARLEAQRAKLAESSAVVDKKSPLLSIHHVPR
ncbi:hypothetical protein MMC30_009207 [Trapelia coarctata]|nr:hypothetical protein [Trapelia coarctata]